MHQELYSSKKADKKDTGQAAFCTCQAVVCDAMMLDHEDSIGAPEFTEQQQAQK